jgi:hypothetical protein
MKPITFKTWEDVLAVVGELDLPMQAEFARIKGVTPPPEVQAAMAKAQAEADRKKAMEEAKSGLKLVYGSGNDTQRVFLTGPGHKINAQAGTRGSYTEVRALDAEIAYLSAARDLLKQAGFNTAPSENPGVGINAARAAGFKVSLGKDVDPTKVYGA